jgi:hypothetical protein
MMAITTSSSTKVNALRIAVLDIVSPTACLQAGNINQVRAIVNATREGQTDRTPANGRGVALARNERVIVERQSDAICQEPHAGTGLSKYIAAGTEVPAAIFCNSQQRIRVDRVAFSAFG